MIKERNKYYKLADMVPGDRFYFLRDSRKKTVYSLYDEKPFETKMQVGIPVRYANCRPDSVPQGMQFTYEQHKLKVNHNDVLVVFLRNINDKKTEQ